MLPAQLDARFAFLFPNVSLVSTASFCTLITFATPHVRTEHTLTLFLEPAKLVCIVVILAVKEAYAPLAVIHSTLELSIL